MIHTLIKINFIKSLKKISLLIVLIQSLNASTSLVLPFTWMKDNQYCLSIKSLKKLNDLFNPNVFIETGTYYGGTTENASLIFPVVHTIELDKKIYLNTKNRLSLKKNISFHLGDSPAILDKILNNFSNQRILLWLDGHFSGGATAMSSKETPVIEELNVISKYPQNEYIILIDDIRECHRKEWPSLREIVIAIRKINMSYRITISGDTLIAFSPTTKVQPSEILNACSISRLFAEFPEEFNLDQVLEAEKTISKAPPEDVAELWELCNNLYSPSSYYFLWYGLTQIESKIYLSQNECFLYKIDPRQINHPRIQKYLSQALIRNQSYSDK